MDNNNKPKQVIYISVNKKKFNRQMKLRNLKNKENLYLLKNKSMIVVDQIV